MGSTSECHLFFARPTMNLAKSLASYGKPEFDDEFEMELRANPNWLPLQGFCQGGFPDEEDLSVHVEEVKADDAHIYVNFRAYFNQTLPSNCADYNSVEPRDADLKVVINRVTGDAHAEVR